MSSEKTESEATQETKKTQSSATTNNDDKKWGWFQTAILIETTLLSFAVMFIDTVLVPALPAIQEKHPDQAHLIPCTCCSQSYFSNLSRDFNKLHACRRFLAFFLQQFSYKLQLFLHQFVEGWQVNCITLKKI